MRVSALRIATLKRVAHDLCLCDDLLGELKVFSIPQKWLTMGMCNIVVNLSGLSLIWS